MTELARSHGTLTIDGSPLTYTVVAEVVPITAPDGQKLGDVSTFSYLRTDVDPGHDRPVLVVFNGGPGAASTPLHLSGLAARTIAYSTDLTRGSATNADLLPSTTSVLDVADLLFIDPVNTGFGRFAPDVDHASAFGLESDANYFASVTRDWLRRNSRLGSPVHVFGESYGTMRAPVLADALLHGEFPIAVHGIGLLGQAVNVQEIAQRATNVAGYVASLPLLAATAHFHGIIEADDVDELIERAHEFAVRVLAPALFLGNSLPVEERDAVAQNLESLTGLPKAEWIRRTLRITKEEFRYEILRAGGLVVGRYDSRTTAPSYDPPRGDLGLDPSFSDVIPHMSLAMERYLSDDLGIDTVENEYRLLDYSASSHWTWALSGEGDTLVDSSKPSPFDSFDYARTLTKHLRENARAHLFVGTGIYDTLTTVGAAKLLVAANDLPLERVHEHTYRAGHMMYTDPSSAAALSADIRRFIAAAR